MNKNLTIFWIIITGAIFLAHHTSSFLEEMVVAGNQIAWLWLFLWYLVWIAVIGTIAGGKLGVLRT